MDANADLQTYKIHLQQVESALLSDPDNGELLKLKADLTEVIKLTVDLETEQAVQLSLPDVDSVDAAASSSSSQQTSWSVGDKCLVQWSEDNQWYKATIDTITSNSMAAVTFVDFSSTEYLSLSSLKDVNDASALITSAAEKKTNNQQKKRQQPQGKDSERFKVRKKKKFDRQKLIEEAHEQDKMKWLSFATKSKKMRGVTKKSIFATPESTNGRVGIGTCGIGGKPMTDFTLAEKRKRGM